MTKRILLLLCFIYASMVSFAQSATDSAIVHSGLRISLLTCGTGTEVYETFGHTAVRVIDSNEKAPFNDLVYNYGMFNGYDKDFEMKFMRGKLDYYVATNFFRDFMEEYRHFGRPVQEQILLINDAQKAEISGYLKENVKPENRYYKYDFFFDNCATRIRDVFPRTLGKDFVYPNVVPKNSRVTFRDIINQYFYRLHWERVGVNILLGSRIDKVMTNMDIMFLPDYLRDGLAGATVSDVKISTPPQLLLRGDQPPPAGPNVPMWGACGILLLTIAGHTVKKLQLLGRIMNVMLLLVTGLLGTLILLMWFGTDHQGCANNYNLLWALPVNIILAVSRPKGRAKYAVIAIFMLLASVLVHLFHVQGLILEFIPIFAALLIVYGSIYKSATNTKSS